MQPWATALAIEGKMYQVRLGTITAFLEGDIDITDTKAESAAEAAQGRTIIPFSLAVDLEALSGGTLPQVAFKTVGALITTLGTAFVPLNLKISGPAASGRAAVSAAGGVTVAAELNTTTRVVHMQTTAVVGTGAKVDEQFDVPHVLVGPASCYLQVGTVTAGVEYFGHYNYAEFVTSDVA